MSNYVLKNGNCFERIFRSWFRTKKGERIYPKKGNVFPILVKVEYFDSIINQMLGIVEDVNSNLISEKLNMANVNSLQRQITSLQIEKESYSQMINRESDRVIYFSTGLFIILGFIGFGIFKYEISNIRKEVAKKSEKQEKKYTDHKELILNEIKEFKKEFLELKYEVYITVSNVHYLNAMHNFKKDKSEHNSDFPDTFFNIVRGIEYQIKGYIIHPEEKYLFDYVDVGFRVINAKLNKLSKNDIDLFRDYFYKDDNRNLKEIKKSIKYFNENINDITTRTTYNEFIYLFEKILKKE